MDTARIFSNCKHALLSIAGPAIAVTTALIVVGIFLLLVGRNPVDAYSGILAGAFGSSFGITETLVVATPIMLCALAVSIADWAGLLSIGAEGQLQMGAVGATFIALAMPTSPAWLVLPVMGIAACLCGAMWSGVPGLLRVSLNVNETITTLLLNYVAILFVAYLIHGPWQDPQSYGWPQTPAFSHSAELPQWPGTRLHLGICFGLVGCTLVWIMLKYTRLGFMFHVIRSNRRAAEYGHYPVARTVLVAMLVSGAVAALAGFGQVSAIEGRLRTGLSPGYGYVGFLVAWLARHNPLAIIVVAILLGGLLAGSDSLQLSEGLPFATVNILQGCILLSLLCTDSIMDRVRSASMGTES